jgi:hypothetical protein
MHARFTSPMIPGDPLKVLAWRDSDTVLFRAQKPDGTVVLDRGRLEIDG